MLDVLTFEPFDLRKVVRQFFKEKYEFDNPGHVASQDSDDSLIEVDNSQTPEEVVLLDNSLISPDSTAIPTAEIMRFPAATIEVIRLEPSESLADMSNLNIGDETLENNLREEEYERAEERGEKEKRSR